MNFLIDIGHPGHVHLYKNLINELKNRGHELVVTVKDIPVALQLLDHYKIPYIKFGKRGNGILAKALKQLLFNIEILKLVRQKRIDIGLGTSMSIAHASRFSKMTSVVFDDDDDQVQPLFTYFAHPFCNFLVSPDALKDKRRKSSTIYYPGYHELAYLHPRRFEPDPEVIREIGVKPGERYFILRFNAFKAYHDSGKMGLTIEDKRRLVKNLSKNGKVFITVENNLEPEFDRYQLRISPDKIHSLIHYASIFISDSMTMSSEAAILGTPFLKCHAFAGRLSVPNELEGKYNLGFSYQPAQVGQLFDKLDELLAEKRLKSIWQERRCRMLQDKIDVTSFMSWFIENLPESASHLSICPNLLQRFK